MGLKARIGIIVVCFMAVMVAGLVFAGVRREALLRQQLDQTAISGSSALWSKIVETGIRRMRELTPLIEESSALRVALVRDDRGLIANAARDLLAELQRSGDVTRLDLVSLSREVLFSSEPAFEPSAAASEDSLAAMIAGRRGGSGVAMDAARNVTLSLGVPLTNPAGELMAVAIYAVDILQALSELKEDTDAEALIVNRRGRLLVGTDPAVWEAVGSLAQLGEDASQRLPSGDRVLSLAAFPLEAELGHLVAQVVTVRDVSAADAEQRRVSLITFVAIGGFVLLSLLALFYYLRRSLAPLTAGVRVLDALSRGDTQATVEVGYGHAHDELGRIADAVNTFRTQTIALRRHRRRAERRQRQQERFIRSEMTRLSSTLNEEERKDILADLAEIEAPAPVLAAAAAPPAKVAPAKVKAARAAAAEAAAEEETRGDLQVMGFAFQKMADRVGRQQERLRTLVAELQEALRTQTAYMALQHDLQVATRVQRSFLPGETLNTANSHIHAAMHAAKEVGGDFYDFFPLDEHRIGIVIGDVAGKGVPASLFMAVTRTVIRATARYVEDGPGKCLEMVNETLVEASRSDLFVTVFYGIYDQRDGTLLYANGGHNPPVVVAPGRVERLPLTGGVALAMFDGLPYDVGQVEIPADGKLFVYTDGVPEAADEAEEEFGYERMEENLLATVARSPRDTIESMLRTVEAFAGAAPQFDDITMLVLGRASVEDTIVVHRFSVHNELSEIPRAVKELGAFAARAGIAAAAAKDLQDSLADVLTTTIDYRLPAGSTYEIYLRASFEDNVAEVTMDDEGPPYEVVDPPPGLGPEERYVSRERGELTRPAPMDAAERTIFGGHNRLVMRKRVSG